MRAFGITLSVFALFAVPVSANTLDERIIVVGEDADQRAIPRTDDSYSRVVSVIQNDLSEAGYFVIDEQMLSAKLGIDFASDRRRQDIVAPLQAANETNDPSVRSRLAFVFSIIPVVQEMTMTNHLNVRVRGDIYDLSTMRMLRSTEVRTKATLKLPSDPLICGDACLLEAVGNQAVDVADELADQLIVALNEQRGTDASPNLYQVSLSGLEMMDAIKLVSAIKKYENITGADLIEDANGQRLYGISTSLDAGGLQEAVLMAMIEQDLDVDQVKSEISGQNLAFSYGTDGPGPTDYRILISGFSKDDIRKFSGSLMQSFGSDAVTLEETGKDMRAFSVETDISPIELEIKMVEVLKSIGITGANAELGEGMIAISAKKKADNDESARLLDPTRREDARAIQAKLKEAGFYKSVVDGLWGNGSREALKAFKRAQEGLPDSDEWDMETQTALDL